MRTTVKLVGTDGNVFAIIGTVAQAIQNSEGRDAANAFREAATQCGSYDEVLQLVIQTVEVE